MTQKQLKILQLVFALLAAVFLTAAGLSGYMDYQIWKQSANQSIGVRNDLSSEQDIPDEKDPSDERTGNMEELSSAESDSSLFPSSGEERKPYRNRRDLNDEFLEGPAAEGIETVFTEQDLTEESSVEAGPSIMEALKNDPEESQNAQPVIDSKSFEISLSTLFLLVLGAFTTLGAVITSALLQRSSSISSQSKEEIPKDTMTETHVNHDNHINRDNDSKLVLPEQLPVCAQFNRLGKRSRQEDCCGILPMDSETLAVLADGMGGLKNGAKVSELVIRTMMKEGERYRGNSENGILLSMLHTTNEAVNRFLGPDIYKSGSTILAVWLQNQGKTFQWISVGDSRIYLYRGGSLIQMNREHNYEQELLKMTAAGKIPLEEVKKDPKKGQLTSFLGMGELKYVDYSIRPIELQAGDRIILMSDGVYNTICEEKIAQAFLQNSDVEASAKQLADAVEQMDHPKQDNFTAVILGI